MSDVVDQSDHSKTIGESKLFRLRQQVSLLEVLVPDLPTQMTAEIEIDEVFPREEGDAQDTRILINYTNIKGNPTIYKVLDTERLERKFDIDHFINGYMNASLAAASQEEDPIAIADKVILLAMNLAITGVLELDPEMAKTPNAGLVSHQVVRCITAILFPNALDVLILVQEVARKEESAETDSIIVGMWGVKLRPGTVG